MPHAGGCCAELSGEATDVAEMREAEHSAGGERYKLRSEAER